MESPFFTYKNNKLYCEDVSLTDLAEQYQTPLYVYSLGALNAQFQSFDKAFGSHDHLICYSMKANSNKAILKNFINQGCGIDVVTMGELQRALNVGCPANRIVFAGVGKQQNEIELAISVGILQFNVESEDELKAIQEIAKKLNKKAPIALRVNPDVDPKTHPYISTGMKKSKFGISHTRAIELYEWASKQSHLEIVGIDCHIGSQLTQVAPFVEATQKIRGLILTLKEKGIQLKNLDLGGGIGICYDNETPPSPEIYAQALLEVTKDLGLKLIFEPGRYLVGNTALLLGKVIYNKKSEAKNFIIIDAASNNLMRPALYGSYHEARPVVLNPERATTVADIVGPICETGDFLATDRKIQECLPDELIAFMSAGAYGYAMSSNYNSRPRCAEVLVKGNQAQIIKEAETLEDLTKGERVPDFI